MDGRDLCGPTASVTEEVASPELLLGAPTFSLCQILEKKHHAGSDVARMNKVRALRLVGLGVESQLPPAPAPNVARRTLGKFL